MIIAAGLSPAWQQIMLFDQFRWGEVNRAAATAWCGSGKVLNVGLALHHLGGPSCTVSPVGGAARGAIMQEFGQLGVPCKWIATQSPTRICTTILDKQAGLTTELVENASPLGDAEVAQFQAAYAEAAAGADVVVLTGSLPAGVPATFYSELLERTSCVAVLDFRGEELLAALRHRPLFIKPNREELRRTFGRSIEDDRDLHGAMRELNVRGAQWVVVSQGKDALLASSSEGLFQFQPPKVTAVVNPIGCGDSLAAGIAWATRAGQGPLEAIALGMAAAADNLSQLLPARLDVERVTAIARTVRWQKIA